jgi:hypothetical protein
VDSLYVFNSLPLRDDLRIHRLTVMDVDRLYVLNSLPLRDELRIYRLTEMGYG